MLEIAPTVGVNTQVLMVLAAALVLVTIGMAIILRGRKGKTSSTKTNLLA